MSTSNTVYIGFNLYANKKFDSSLLDILPPDTIVKNPAILELVMPPSNKAGAPIPQMYLEALTLAGFAGVYTFADLMNEYKTRSSTAPDKNPAKGSTNHSMFTTYQSSIVSLMDQSFSNDMSPLAFKSIVDFNKDVVGVNYNVDNNLALLPADMVKHFSDENGGDYSLTYAAINEFINERTNRDLYRFKMTWDISLVKLALIYKRMKAEGLRATGIIAACTVSYDAKSNTVTNINISADVNIVEAFDFSEGIKLTKEDIENNVKEINSFFNKTASSPLARSWNKDQAASKTQKKKEMKRGLHNNNWGGNTPAPAPTHAPISTGAEIVVQTLGDAVNMDDLDSSDC
jgi:hypothetical protein